MILLKEIEVMSLTQLHLEEKKYINMNDDLILNSRISFRSVEDKQEWFNNHKEQKKEYDRLYRQKNIDLLRIKESERYYRKKREKKIE
jgi:hypothetical protein